jgi:hypothetical protein
MSAKLDQRKVWHVYPMNDLQPHVVDGHDVECRCVPQIRPEGLGILVIHNAFDHREEFERV